MLLRMVSHRSSDREKINAIHNYTRDVTTEDIGKILDHLSYKAKVEAVRIFLSRHQLNAQDITRIIPYFHSDSQKLEVIQEALSHSSELCSGDMRQEALPYKIDATTAMRLFDQMQTIDDKKGVVIKLRESFDLEQLPILAKECGYYFILQYFRPRIFGSNYIFTSRCITCEKYLMRYWFQAKPEIGHSCYQCSPSICKYCQTIRLWKHGMVVRNVDDLRKSPTLLDQALEQRVAQSLPQRHRRHSPVSPLPTVSPLSSLQSQVTYPNKLDEDVSASESEKRGLCVVCKIHYHKTVNFPCMHACLCFHCAKAIAEDNKKLCPVCREPLTEIKQLYLL